MHFPDNPRIAAIGLTYVEPPRAVTPAGHFETIGCDIDSEPAER